MHSLDIFRVVGVAEQPPFGERERLTARGGEFGLRPQPVRLVDEIFERLARGLVVAVGPDDVDDVVAGIALRPGNRVPSPRGSEIETETRAGHRAHCGDDPPPVRLPRARVGGASAAVGGAVHLPAENDDRVAGPHGHEPLGQDPVVVVERPRGAAAQQRAQDGRRQPGLVGRHHRHVDDQHPARVGRLPPRPRREHPTRALDLVPVVARQVGPPDRHRGAEPSLEAAHPGDALRARSQKRPQGHVSLRFPCRLGLRPLVRPRLLPGRRCRRDEREQHDRCPQNGRERTEWAPPFPWPSGCAPG